MYSHLECGDGEDILDNPIVCIHLRSTQRQFSQLIIMV
jgi:hypothetical protein